MKNDIYKDLDETIEERFVRNTLSAIKRYYSNEENYKKYLAWKESRDEVKS